MSQVQLTCRCPTFSGVINRIFTLESSCRKAGPLRVKLSPELAVKTRQPAAVYDNLLRFVFIRYLR